MSTHLPVDPNDPNRGGIPFDAPASPEDVLAVLNALRPEPSGDVVVTDLGGGIVDIVGRGRHLVMPRSLMEFLQSDRGREVLARHDTTIDAMLAPPAPRSPAEAWPGQHEHHRQHDLMMAEHTATGIYRDPVSGREFPPGGVMLRDPNREQRRRLKAWRASGKVRR